MATRARTGGMHTALHTRSLLSALLVTGLVWVSLPLAPRPCWADSRFDAYALDKPTLVFTGQQTVTRSDGLVTEHTVFVDPAGHEMQTVALTYDASSLRPLSYRKVDSRDGEAEGIETAKERTVLTYRASSQKDAKTDSVEWKPGMLAPETMPERIRLELDRLLAGETLLLELLVPSQLGTVGFRARLEGEAEIDGVGAVVIRAEPSFWLFRAFLPPLFLSYARAAPHRLLEYRGRTSVKTDDGDPIYARIVYHPLPGS